MLGFFIAFAVKLPVVPFHSWLPDAHAQAPTAGRVDLAGILLKTAAYGLLRFALPLFPNASAEFAPIAMTLGRDRHLLRRVPGLRADRHQASDRLHLRLPHGLRADRHLLRQPTGAAGRGDADAGARPVGRRHCSSSAVSCTSACTPATCARWAACGRSIAYLPAISLFFAAASLGLPGTGNFVGEFLILLGTFPAAPVDHHHRDVRPGVRFGLLADHDPPCVLRPGQIGRGTAWHGRSRTDHGGRAWRRC